MKITEIRCAGLRGATPEGGWSNELRPDDCIHTLVVVHTDEGLTGLGSAFTSDTLAKGALQILEPLYRGENALEPERVSEKLHQNTFWLGRGGSITHTISGIDIALWDLLGKRLGEPVWRLLGYERTYPKLPYASMLFGATPQATLEKGRAACRAGYRAAKFGWGPIGLGSAELDADHFMAAREGLGTDGILLIDIGTVWQDDVNKAALRLPALQACRATWLEEPFASGALNAYRVLAKHCGSVKLAAGEGSHTRYMAEHLIDYAGLGYVQIDAGRIGGLSVAKQVADYAHARSVAYVNHTFTSHLALSASLQPFAGLEQDVICEYPFELKALAVAITENHLLPDRDGYLHTPDAPGLGMRINRNGLQPFLVDVEIRVGDKVLYRPPKL